MALSRVCASRVRSVGVGLAPWSGAPRARGGGDRGPCGQALRSERPGSTGCGPGGGAAPGARRRPTQQRSGISRSQHPLRKGDGVLRIVRSATGPFATGRSRKPTRSARGRLSAKRDAPRWRSSIRLGDTTPTRGAQFADLGPGSADLVMGQSASTTSTTDLTSIGKRASPRPTARRRLPKPAQRMPCVPSGQSELCLRLRAVARPRQLAGPRAAREPAGARGNLPAPRGTASTHRVGGYARLPGRRTARPGGRGSCSRLPCEAIRRSGAPQRYSASRADRREEGWNDRPAPLPEPRAPRACSSSVPRTADGHRPDRRGVARALRCLDSTGAAKNCEEGGSRAGPPTASRRWRPGVCAPPTV